MIPRQRVRIAWFLLPGLLIGCSSQSPAEIDLLAEAQAIRDLDVALSQAAQDKDPEAFTFFFAEDATQLPPNSPQISGRNAIQEAAAGLLGAGADLRFETMGVKVASSGDLAFSKGKYFLSLETPDGLIQDEGSYIEVWEKVAGEWKIISDIYNSDLPAG